MLHVLANGVTHVRLLSPDFCLFGLFFSNRRVSALSQTGFYTVLNCSAWT